MNIRPKDQTVEKCLQQRKYYIDFYQRKYVWNNEIVQTLLEDIFHPFEISYEEHKDEDLTEEVIHKYNWYYLNVYITNNIDGKEYIVDGQQRLTTLTLIAIKLLKLCPSDENLTENLKNCIRGKDKYGGDIFWIDDEKRKHAMSAILGDKSFTDYKSVTEENLIGRYSEISRYFDEKFKNFDEKKIRAFIFYFLERLVLVELKIEKDDTPMVFEVINDRGFALKPFEILKGKMIGSLNKSDTDTYSNLWEDAINNLKEIEDDFFKDYLKSKFIFKRNSDIEKAINNQYHRYIFEDNDIADGLKIRRKDQTRIENIKSFIKENLSYYSDLYAEIRLNHKNEFLNYNNQINGLSGQYQNILAACKLDDENKEEKIKTIAEEVDRLYIILHLNGIYDSNDFQEISYKLNEKLTDAELEQYRNIFNEIIETQIKEVRNVDKVNSILDYDRFKNLGYDNLSKRVIRYLFARVEQHLCDSIKENMKKSVHDISTKTGEKTGYHIEHILSNNDESISKFFNVEEFEDQRNKIGGLLLLYGRNNISSGNEAYKDKLKTYSNGLFWGRTLTKDCYHTNLNFKDFNEKFKSETGVEFRWIDDFDKEALEDRTKLLYQLVKKIWSI